MKRAALMHSAVPRLVKTYLPRRSCPLMADYLLHLVGGKLTSGYHADDSAGNAKKSDLKGIGLQP